MSQLLQDAATARDKAEALKEAVRAWGDPGIGGYLTSLNDALNPALDDPASVDQTAANAIGAALVNMQAAVSGYSSLMPAEADLHDFLSQAMVTHYPSLDWYAAAGVSPTESGGKHKPD